MHSFQLVIILVIVALPIAWFASEFQPKRWLRLVAGSAAILSTFGVAYVVGSLERLKYNAWYGSASKELIDASVESLERGRTESVLTALKNIQHHFAPTYETKANFDQLAEQAAVAIRSKE